MLLYQSNTLWIADNSVGTRANLSGVIMETPVYQFYLGKYNAVATKDYLRVDAKFTLGMSGLLTTTSMVYLLDFLTKKYKTTAVL